MAYRNSVQFMVTGDYALFSDPIMRIGGEKCSYPVPTYEALKGILSSVYWKPTFIWYVDRVRVVNKIQMASKGIRTLRYYDNSKPDLSYYMYLRNCCYQVEAHFEWNLNRPELADDRNENKHHNIAKRMIERGGRRDIFLGTRECQGYVESCVFGEGEGAYDHDVLSFGFMLHGITYPDEAYSEDTKGKMTVRFWHPVMRNGILTFPRPEECASFKTMDGPKIKAFGNDLHNFCGFNEFER